MASTSVPLLARGLPLDTKVNLIIGALTIVIGILSTILAWATWRLTRDRHLRRGHQSPPEESVPLQTLPASEKRLGYELALRIGRSSWSNRGNISTEFQEGVFTNFLTKHWSRKAMTPQNCNLKFRSKSNHIQFLLLAISKFYHSTLRSKHASLQHCSLIRTEHPTFNDPHTPK